MIANTRLLKIAADNFCAVYVKNDGKYFAFHAAVCNAFVAGADWALQQKKPLAMPQEVTTADVDAFNSVLLIHDRYVSGDGVKAALKAFVASKGTLE